MTYEKLEVCIEEYRSLVEANRDSECIKAYLKEKLNEYSGITYPELVVLCRVYGVKKESGEAS